jgi:hypothetical protein
MENAILLTVHAASEPLNPQSQRIENTLELNVSKLAVRPRFEDLPLRKDDPPFSAWGLWGDDDEIGTLVSPHLLIGDCASDGVIRTF